MTDKHRWSKAFARESSSKLTQLKDTASSFKQNCPSSFSKTQDLTYHDVTVDITNNYQNLMNYFGDDRKKEEMAYTSKYAQWKVSQDELLRRNEEESIYERVRQYLDNGRDYIYQNDDLQSHFLRKAYQKQYALSQLYRRQNKANKYAKTAYLQSLKAGSAQDISLLKTSINYLPNNRYWQSETDSQEVNEHKIYRRLLNSNSQSQSVYRKNMDTYYDWGSDLIKRSYSFDKFGVNKEIKRRLLHQRYPYIQLKSKQQNHQNCVYCKNNRLCTNVGRCQVHETKQYNSHSPITSGHQRPVSLGRQPNYINNQVHFVQPQQIISSSVRYVQPSQPQQIIRQVPINYVKVLPQTQLIWQPNQQHYTHQIVHPQPHYTQQLIHPQPQPHYTQYIVQPQPHYTQHIVQPQPHYTQHIVQPQPYNQQIPQQYIQQAPQQYVIQKPQYHYTTQLDNSFHRPSVVIQQEQPIQSRKSSNHSSNMKFSDTQIITQAKLHPSNFMEQTIAQPQFLMTPSLTLSKTKGNTLVKSRQNLKSVYN